MSEKAPWITYRPELKVLDCTIRDGGLVNDHQFDNDLVKATYETCVEIGIDYMEIGYKNSKKQFPKDKFGPFRHCDEEDMRKIVGDNPTNLKLAAMADAGKSDYQTDILPKDQSVLDMIRVATYVHQIPIAVDMIHDAHEKGYEVSCNIMAISIATNDELDQALEEIAKTPAGTAVIVDSFGALYQEQVERLANHYKQYLDGTGKDIGVHMHDNQRLAFANTIEGIIHGANRVDATVQGLGRGAGNCPMEVLLGFLRNPKFKIRPLFKLIEDYYMDLRKQLDWGPSVPYIITGQHNRHPRAAIQWRATDKKDNFTEFYDNIEADV